jgi:hypothetical protein
VPAVPLPVGNPSELLGFNYHRFEYGSMFGAQEVLSEEQAASDRRSSGGWIHRDERLQLARCNTARRKLVFPGRRQPVCGG